MKQRSVSTFLVLAGCAIALLAPAQAKSLRDEEEPAVIPSPNEHFATDMDSMDIVRRPAATGSAARHQAAAASSVPVYVSPFVRAERALAFERQESSHAPPNYAPRPQASSQLATGSDPLKTSASYGHHHGGYHGGHHGGYDHGGWLDMGAWTGGKGSFGWYADYPVGSKHHGYGRK